jgi:hypothetical protein
LAGKLTLCRSERFGPGSDPRQSDRDTVTSARSNGSNLASVVRGPDGQRVAIFYTKVHDRLPRPLLAADQPPAPIELRRALATIDNHVRGCIDHARLGRAA